MRAHAEPFEVLLIEHANPHAVNAVKFLSHAVDEGLRVDDIAGFGSQVSSNENANRQVGEVVIKLRCRIGVVTEDDNVTASIRVEPLLLVAVKAVVAKAITKRDVSCGGAGRPVDVRPE